MRNGSPGRRWSRLFRPEPRREIEDELAFHFEERVREYIARGMDPAAARAAAQRRLGDLQAVRSECAELLSAERRLEARRDWARFSWLDFKLGFRMLRKYPGLTEVGGVAMAFAIAVGAVAFEFLIQVMRPKVPLPDGDRIVALRLWDAAAGRVEGRALFDFVTWRNELKSVRDLGVFRTVERNLIGADGRGASVTAAEMTAAGFRLARVPPLLGRTLTEEDERPGAPAVVVIGERVWRTQFNADPGVIGRVVHVGSERRTVVGVMPEKFAFPLYHSAWTPFPYSLNAAGYAAREGPHIRIFGRLAAGFTLDQARAELVAVGVRARHDYPRTHQHLQAQVVPYSESQYEAEALWLTYFGNSFSMVLLLLIYANVALLMFGRVAARESEMVVRNALGASRGRILTQLFAEALVLGGVGAAIGVGFARVVMGWVFDLIRLNRVELPFWYHASLSPVTLLYALGLTLVAALIAGVLPGLKVTRGVGAQLRAASAGAGGLRFGRGWTVIIVAQVAFTAAFFPLLITLAVETYRARTLDIGVAAGEYLAIRVERDEAESPVADAAPAFAAMTLELKRRVLAEPGVAAVTYAQHLPGEFHPAPVIEVEGVGTLLPSGVRLRASRATVDVDFFPAMDIPLLSGRAFHPADAGSDAPVVIVNESFVRDVLGGRNPIGQRLRLFHTIHDAHGGVAEKPGPWHEIVGLVRDVAMSPNPRAVRAGVYQPMSLDGASAVDMAVRVRGDPLALAPQLRSHAAAVDPALRLRDIQPLEELARDYLYALTLGFRVMIGVGAVALLLSLAGIYSIMAFAVARRTREIGIRVALGSSRLNVIASVFSRALVHVGLGVATGIGLFLAFSIAGLNGFGAFRWSENLALVAAYGVFMAGVCLLSCVVPARRALRVEPTEALRADA